MSPKEAMELTKEERKLLSTLEEELNEWLSDNISVDGKTFCGENEYQGYSNRKLRGVSYKLRDELIRSCLEKGWEVEEDKYTNGDIYFKFSVKKK